MDSPAYENEQIPRPGQMARRLGEDHNNGARGLHLPQGRQAWKHPWSNNIKEHHMCNSRLEAEKNAMSPYSSILLILPNSNGLWAGTMSVVICEA